MAWSSSSVSRGAHGWSSAVATSPSSAAVHAALRRVCSRTKTVAGSTRPSRSSDAARAPTASPTCSGVAAASTRCFGWAIERNSSSCKRRSDSWNPRESPCSSGRPRASTRSMTASTLASRYAVTSRRAGSTRQSALYARSKATMSSPLRLSTAKISLLLRGERSVTTSRTPGRWSASSSGPTMVASAIV